MKKSILQFSAIAFACLALPAISQAASVNGVNVKQVNGKTIVSGTVNRGAPAHSSLGAHVHVELVDTKGKVIDRAVRSLSVSAPRKDASRNYRANYSVSFDSAPSATARVKYVTGPHHESC